MALTVALLLVAIALLLGPMRALSAAILCMLLGWLVWMFHDSEARWRGSAEGLAATLTSFALMLGAYWYLVERRGVPKVDVEPSGQAWAVPGGGLLVRAEVKISNVGDTSVRLDRDPPNLIYLGLVHPVSGDEELGLLSAMRRKAGRRGVEFELRQTDNWPLLAAHEKGVDSVVIESGETERLYYKAIVPCQDGAVLALTAKVPKRVAFPDSLFDDQKQTLYWVGQSLITTTGSCEE